MWGEFHERNVDKNFIKTGHTLTLSLRILLINTATHLGAPSRTIRGMSGARLLYSSLESSHLRRSKMCAVKCCNTHSSACRTRGIGLGLTSGTDRGGTEGNRDRYEGSLSYDPRPLHGPVGFNNAVPIHLFIL
jgi:hypothetical protein